jgi:hypothetical protein
VYVQYPTKGTFPRLANVASCGRLEGDVQHVTGDVDYAALGLPKRKSILTIHDQTLLMRLKGIRKFVAKIIWFYLPIRHVRYVTLISYFTKQDLLKQDQMDESKIRGMPNAIDFTETPLPRNTDPRFLQIGTSFN